jgi:hypothetical protein
MKENLILDIENKNIFTLDRDKIFSQLYLDTGMVSLSLRKKP